MRIEFAVTSHSGKLNCHHVSRQFLVQLASRKPSTLTPPACWASTPIIFSNRTTAGQIHRLPPPHIRRVVNHTTPDTTSGSFEMDNCTCQIRMYIAA